MKNRKRKFVQAAALLIGLLSFGFTMKGATDCTFIIAGTTMTLDADCTTDATLFIPDGFTLDGAGHTISVVDPVGGHFLGGVVKNEGSWAGVTNLKINASGLNNVCDSGNDRLRGVLFDGASGFVTNVEVMALNQGPSGCQEGNAIEIRSEPFDGTHPNTKTAMVSNVTLDNWQKSGIVANGDVDVTISDCKIGPSSTQLNLAANSIQFGFGALGKAINNQVAQNSWCCPSAAATGILLFSPSPGLEISKNVLNEGNADVGIYVFGDDAKVDNNKVFESGPDGFYDIGIGNYGAGNAVTNNKVRGYQTPYDGVDDGNNKTIPLPQEEGNPSSVLSPSEP